MSIIELLIISVGLAMDAFAVSVAKGLGTKSFAWKNAVICGLYFGLFQALMPAIGYFLGYGFRDLITEIDHWIAFILLTAIGISMMRGGEEEEAPKMKEDFSFSTMLPLAIATSIDALIVGITFAFLKVEIWKALSAIGIITFILSVIGVKAGSVFGNKYRKKASLVGGIILILIGLKTLLEHLGILSLSLS